MAIDQKNQKIPYAMRPRKRFFSKAMVRSIALSDAKKANTPRFRCAGCNVIYAMTFSKYMYDTSKPFSSPTYVCLDCACLSKYNKAD